MTNGTSQGLFVVVAIVIFGIFVLISYVLFKDNLKPTLANIFTDGLEQAEENLTGIVKEKPINVQSSREDENYLYAKIRDANEAKNETEIWVQATKLNNGTLELYKSSTSDGNYIFGSSNMTGSLAIPDTINGMKIVKIGQVAFTNSKFDGELKLPDRLTSIGSQAFANSTFDGELKLPDSLTSIGWRAFTNSTFVGTLDVSHVKYIQRDAFSTSRFDKVIRGDVEMSDRSIGENTSGIHPETIKLANGSWYDGSNA